ncbi:uncharacterized protein BHQ10_004730 [Talaromyces amestolkiae]|uniref:FAD-binding domain-containing protein n=1 Tax=Talaromyces amestolkiae TaxID=1196081 RepID=A0A364KYU3_TALAM|nr:uncharacterized protein BHQ10_004730 [Talaromyces amestolkiae]RAO68718.1 hypothetical protein BHQ10_004730 [Talaromyces amestolkiae]
MSGSPTKTVDVTIIGAGPTGLASAVLARQLGLTVCIVDQGDEPLKVGRADALNSRTQDYFDMLGILPSLQELGLKCNTSSTFANGEFISRQSHWWTSLKHTTYPNFLMLGQPVIMQHLAKILDTPVIYKSQLQDLIETEDKVTAVLDNMIVESKYVIGADGARSKARQILNIPFEGTKPEMVWAVLDTFLDTDFPLCPEIITFQVDGQARVSWIPRERGLARFYILLDDEITQENSEKEIRKFLAPYRVDFPKTEWFSTFEIKERLARSYFSPGGRIVLAGDAAHVHAVNGGQGLNTGISDAFALVWRLYLGTKGYESLVKTYELERRHIAADVLSVAAKLVRSTLRTATEYVEIVEKNAAYITGGGIKYLRDTKTVSGADADPFVPGYRCPDLTLTRGDGATVRLYQVLKYSSFTILRVNNAEVKIPEAAVPFSNVWDLIIDDKAADDHTEEQEVASKTLSYNGTPLPEWVHGVVIRPDAYVGYVGEDAGQYLSGIFQN